MTLFGIKIFANMSEETSFRSLISILREREMTHRDTKQRMVGSPKQRLER